MIDFDVEPRRGALAPDEVLTLIDGPEHAQVALLVADQETSQRAQRARCYLLWIYAGAWRFVARLSREGGRLARLRRWPERCLWKRRRSVGLQGWRGTLRAALALVLTPGRRR
jgi:hypothetical protein